jgi:hypothetical protein
MGRGEFEKHDTTRISFSMCVMDEITPLILLPPAMNYIALSPKNGARRGLNPEIRVLGGASPPLIP